MKRHGGWQLNRKWRFGIRQFSDPFGPRFIAFGLDRYREIGFGLNDETPTP